MKTINETTSPAVFGTLHPHPIADAAVDPRVDSAIDVEALRWPLTPVQRLLAPCLGLAERVCEAVARRLGRPRLLSRENTRRCYERVFDPLCSDTGIWPDYTEGYFARGDESYEQAKRAQLDFILDRTECKAGTRVLDLGCGNGRLLERARARGCDASGVTISRAQARTCQAAGLDVRVCSFDQIAEVFEPRSFDVIVLNGSTEHFVGEDQAAQGREEEIHRQLFDDLARLLRPGGRVFVTCIHFRWPTKVQPTLGSPLRHPIGSYYFFTAILVATYSGWYPHTGQYDAAADRAGFDLVFERDATADYLQTSKLWKARLDRLCLRRPGFVARFVARSFWDDPRYALVAFLYWLYAAWSWQFRPTDAGPAPMVHRWLMFQRRA